MPPVGSGSPMWSYPPRLSAAIPSYSGVPLVKLPPCPKTAIAERLPDNDPAFAKTSARLLLESLA